MAYYLLPLTLRGFLMGAPHVELAFSEQETLEKIRESVLSDSWRVVDVVDARGQVALTRSATDAVRAEALAVVEDLKRGGDGVVKL